MGCGDVQQVALSMSRQLSAEGLQTLRDHSRSFADLAAQVRTHRDEIVTAPDCW
jgi:hypothetical protein